MKVHVIIRGLSEKDWEKYVNYRIARSIKVVYCGYLEVDDPFNRDLWHLCNWSCWTSDQPKECVNLLIDCCNSDVSFYVEGNWYSHAMDKFESFEECYTEMTNGKSFKHFIGLWPYDYGFPDEYLDKIKLVNPDNINQFIN